MPLNQDNVVIMYYTSLYCGYVLGLRKAFQKFVQTGYPGQDVAEAASGDPSFFIYCLLVCYTCGFCGFVLNIFIAI